MSALPLLGKSKARRAVCYEKTLQLIERRSISITSSLNSQPAEIGARALYGSNLVIAIYIPQSKPILVEIFDAT